MTGVLHLISLCLLLNLILASDLRHHNECAYCGDNKKCCLLLDRYQCLGAEYACGQIEPYQACHFERCPLLSDSNRKLCMLSGIRYYYCESRDCGNSRNSCADGTAMQSSYIIPDHANNLRFGKSYAVMIIFCSIMLFLSRNLETMKHKHIPLLWANLFGYAIYARFAESTQSSDWCSIVQLSITWGFLFTSFVKLAQLCVYISHLKHQTQLLEQFKSTKNDNPMPSYTTLYHNGWLYALLFTLVTILLTLCYMVTYTDISLLDPTGCSTSAHDVLKDFIKKVLISITILRATLYYIYREALLPFSRGLEVWSDVILKFLFMTSQISLDSAFPIHNQYTSRIITSALKYPTSEINHYILTIIFYLDLIFAIILPVIYDFYVKMRLSIISNEIRERFERHNRSPILMNLILTYSAKENAIYDVGIYSLLIKMREVADIERIQLANYIICLCQQQFGVVYYLGFDATSEHLLTANTYQRARNHMEEKFIIPMFARISVTGNFPILELVNTQK